MLTIDGLDLPARRESLSAVLSDGLEQVVADRLTRAKLTHNQRLAYELPQQVKYRVGFDAAAGTHLLSGVHPEAACEHRQPTEQVLLSLSQQRITPVQGSPHRLLARGCHTGSSGEQAQRIADAFRNLRYRQQW